MLPLLGSYAAVPGCIQLVKRDTALSECFRRRCGMMSALHKRGCLFALSGAMPECHISRRVSSHWRGCVPFQAFSYAQCLSTELPEQSELFCTSQK